MVDEAMSHYHMEVGVTVSKAEVEVWSGVGRGWPPGILLPLWLREFWVLQVRVTLD